MTTAEAPRRRGRPRDPDMEPRVYAAAIEVYSRRGWHGFSLEAVARTAGVGQAALYRRWSSKGDLLAHAVQAAERPLPTIDSGSSREDLAALAHHLISLYRGPSGVVGLRLLLDARTHPELAEQFTVMMTASRSQDVRHIVRRAAQRGDLQPSASLAVLLQVLVGATLGHVLLGDGHGTTSQAYDDRFVQELVDRVLLAD